jgi:predicted AAA+ superfamily ATPase
MVVTLKNEVVPIEVKYSNEIGKRDLRGIVKFCEEFDSKGIVVTKDILKDEGNFLFIPAWLFLLVAS